MMQFADRRPAVISALRRRGPGIAADIGVNVLAPLFLYYLALERGGVIAAMIAAALPPLVANGLSYARTRRLDALSAFALASILSPLITTVGGGSGQALQLHLKLPLLLFGMAFLASAALGKPLVLPLARATVARESAAALARFEASLDDAHLSYTMLVMTLVWGGALVIEFGANAVLIYGTSQGFFSMIAPILGFSAGAGLLTWTMIYRRVRTSPNRESPAFAHR